MGKFVVTFAEVVFEGDLPRVEWSVGFDFDRGFDDSAMIYGLYAIVGRDWLLNMEEGFGAMNNENEKLERKSESPKFDDTL